MSACHELRGLLVGHVQGELAPLERTLADAHLAHCPACRAVRADIAAGLAAARKEPEVDVERLIALFDSAEPTDSYDIDTPEMAHLASPGPSPATAPGAADAVVAQALERAAAKQASARAATRRRTVLVAAAATALAAAAAMAIVVVHTGDGALAAREAHDAVDDVGLVALHDSVDVKLTDDAHATPAATPAANAVDDAKLAPLVDANDARALGVLTRPCAACVATDASEATSAASVGATAKESLASGARATNAGGASFSLRSTHVDLALQTSAGPDGTLDELLPLLDEAERLGRSGDGDEALSRYHALATSGRFAKHKGLIEYDRARLQGLVLGDVDDALRALDVLARGSGHVASEARLTRCEVLRKKNPCAAVACLDGIVGEAAADAHRLRARWGETCPASP
jgi:hypothetical protein